MKGPIRKQIQRSSGIVGSPPTGSGTYGSDPRYPAVYQGDVAHAAKIERDRLVNLAKISRPRYAGAMKPRSRGDAIRNGNGNGESFNGGLPYNGGGAPAVAGAGADNWWMNPLLWAAILGLYLVTRKGKK